MAEIIGVVSGVIGIAAVALELTKGVKEIINTLMATDNRLNELADELDVLSTILIQVTRIAESKTPGCPISIALKSCQKGLLELDKLLRGCRKRSEGKMTTIINSVSVYLKEKEIVESVEKLQRHENRVGLALLSHTVMYGLPTCGD